MSKMHVNHSRVVLDINTRGVGRILEFSQTLSCLYQAMKKKNVFCCLILDTSAVKRVKDSSCDTYIATTEGPRGKSTE